MARAIGCIVSLGGFSILPVVMMGGLIAWADMAAVGSDQASSALLILIASVVLWFACVVGLLALAIGYAKRREVTRNGPRT